MRRCRPCPQLRSWRRRRLWRRLRPPWRPRNPPPSPRRPIRRRPRPRACLPRLPSPSPKRRRHAIPPVRNQRNRSSRGYSSESRPNPRRYDALSAVEYCRDRANRQSWKRRTDHADEYRDHSSSRRSHRPGESAATVPAPGVTLPAPVTQIVPIELPPLPLPRVNVPVLPPLPAAAITLATTPLAALEGPVLPRWLTPRRVSTSSHRIPLLRLASRPASRPRERPSVGAAPGPAVLPPWLAVLVPRRDAARAGAPLIRSAPGSSAVGHTRNRPPHSAPRLRQFRRSASLVPPRPPQAAQARARAQLPSPWRFLLFLPRTPSSCSVGSAV